MLTSRVKVRFKTQSSGSLPNQGSSRGYQLALRGITTCSLEELLVLNSDVTTCSVEELVYMNWDVTIKNRNPQKKVEENCPASTCFQLSTVGKATKAHIRDYRFLFENGIFQL